MQLYPAIDILQGRAVRLVQGDFDSSTVYDADPLAAARTWVKGGATWLHVVDLDGARAGEPVSIEHLRKIVEELRIPVQYGGGLRSIEALEAAIDAGARRIVLGTAALTDPHLLDAALDRWPDHLVVAVDARGGRVATGGWLATTQVTVEEVIERMCERRPAPGIH